ncbi:hypothetical protein HGI47_13310 [Novosphingobium sp. ERN07]|uniref:hypothetical protein n=1 Tax=Novosphingobium sp. ERN07 TaxID=2726187 RepID=UPI0014569CA7|nr:hypothetical protein [Novosphingobium sp. ERN07]NLR71849.1 hypothetical protein [Novosphingobium sp. ERN07]
MSNLANLLAPVGMLLSFATTGPVASGDVSGEWAAASIPTESPLFVGQAGSGAFADFIAQGLEDDTWNQVRVEQRMIIRIAPRMPGSMLAPPPDPRFSGPPQPPRFFERKADKCLAIASIAGVQIESQDRLLLVTRNRKLIGASLDKSCSARDFYSGFYVDRSEDGQLCAGRDTIHSRAGANCAITKMRELVPDDD